MVAIYKQMPDDTWSNLYKNETICAGFFDNFYRQNNFEYPYLDYLPRLDGQVCIRFGIVWYNRVESAKFITNMTVKAVK